MRIIRSCAAFIANVGAAFIGTTIIETHVSSALKSFTHSPASMVIREWICSIVLAAMIGIFVRHRWGTSIAKWTWLPGLLWFLFGLAGGIGFRVDNPWETFSGIACTQVRGIHCSIFWTFTVPLIRTASYSLGASLADCTRSLQPAFSRLFAGLFLIGLPKLNNQQATAEQVDFGKNEDERSNSR